MNKAHIKFLVLLLLNLQCGVVKADSGRFRGEFFLFGKNTVETAEGSNKDQQRQKKTDKTIVRKWEKRDVITNKEQSKNLSKQTTDNANIIKKNRLTPEERLALRRQIQDASNDLYVIPK